MDLEEFAEGKHEIAFKAFDEFVISCDSEDGGEEMVKAWYFSALLSGMGGGVVFFGCAEWCKGYAWSWGNSESKVSLQETLLEKRLLNKDWSNCINIICDYILACY